MSAYLFWLVLALICLGLEAVAISGIGLLFAGLGAFTVGVWLIVAGDLSVVGQGIVFFAATVLWAAILWKPLQRFRIRKNGTYNNIVGDTAYIGGGGLKKGEVGEATWSGTIMKAELSAESGVDSLAGGVAVTIAAVSGNKLVVKPKSS